MRDTHETTPVAVWQISEIPDSLPRMTTWIAHWTLNQAAPRRAGKTPKLAASRRTGCFLQQSADQVVDSGLSALLGQSEVVAREKHVLVEPFGANHGTRSIELCAGTRTQTDQN